MKKEKVNYLLQRTNRLIPKQLTVKRDLSFEFKLAAQLVLDQSIAGWNKAYFDREIDRAIEANNQARFNELLVYYRYYAWEY
ncbi:hypothetical protein ACS127_09710 [Amphibacillus sp. Q70]|uniref:hypothetical protein n=1 Tax=Amphibacillus sp. Q70 TaxID=3453416 RepID=UPI003F87EFB2